MKAASFAAAAIVLLTLTPAKAEPLLAGCGALLPRGESVAESPWQNFQEAQQAFDSIVPYQSTVGDLRKLKLDPLL